MIGICAVQINERLLEGFPCSRHSTVDVLFPGRLNVCNDSARCWVDRRKCCTRFRSHPFIVDEQLWTKWNKSLLASASIGHSFAQIIYTLHKTLRKYLFIAVLCYSLHTVCDVDTLGAHTHTTSTQSQSTRLTPVYKTSGFVWGSLVSFDFARSNGVLQMVAVCCDSAPNLLADTRKNCLPVRNILRIWNFRVWGCVVLRKWTECSRLSLSRSLVVDKLEFREYFYSYRQQHRQHRCLKGKAMRI